MGLVGLMAGVPSVPTPFAMSLARMVVYNERWVAPPNADIRYVPAGHSYHASARNSLANQRQGEWTLMLDTDQEFAPDTLGSLLRTMNAHEMDVVTGVYYQKGPPHMPLVYRAREEGGFQILSEFPDDKPFRVAAAGAGCLLIRNTVFDRIEAAGDEGPFSIRPPLSEDLSFFDRLLELDIEVWCDPRVQTGHLQSVAITAEDHRRAVGGMETIRYPAVALEVS